MLLASNYSVFALSFDVLARVQSQQVALKAFAGEHARHNRAVCKQVTPLMDSCLCKLFAAVGVHSQQVTLEALAAKHARQAESKC